MQSAIRSSVSRTTWPISGSLSGGPTTQLVTIARLPIRTVTGPASGPLLPPLAGEGRVGGAEDSHLLIDEADVAQPLAVADVVIAQDEEPPARAVPEGCHRRRLGLRMHDVAQADDEILEPHPAAPGLQQVVVHLQGR